MPKCLHLCTAAFWCEVDVENVFEVRCGVVVGQLRSAYGHRCQGTGLSLNRSLVKACSFVLSLKAVLSKMHFLRVVVHAPGVAVILTSTAVVKWSSLLVARSMVWCISEYSAARFQPTGRPIKSILCSDLLGATQVVALPR